jgi:hypothetical protein
MLDASCTINPPEKQARVFKQVDLHDGGTRGGKSLKLGIVRLDVCQLLLMAGSGTLSAAPVIASP